jgi:Ca-activated chloride channel homolog
MNSTWHFAHPWFLLLIGLLPKLAQWLWGRTGTIAFPAVPLLLELPATPRSVLRRLAGVFVLVGYLCCVIALARPRSPNAPTRVEQDGIAIMMIVDRSSSMEARDLVPGDLSKNRLSVVKEVFRDFVLGTGMTGIGTTRGRPDDVIGLVSFAGYADSLCPLTLDHDNLVSMVDELEIARDDEDGTSVGDALALAVSRLKLSKAKSRVAILLTDGVNNRGVIKPAQAAEMAKELGVRVYCIGTGTNGDAPLPTVDRFGRSVLVRAPVLIDEASLKAIALQTSGKYFRATDARTLAEVYSQIDQLEKSQVESEQYLRYSEHYEVFAGWGAVLVLAGILSASTFLRTYPQ